MINAHDSIIVRLTAQLLIPIIRLFALYVFFHGHYSPGGGFQAGVLMGASFILEMLIGTKKENLRFSVHREFLLATLGIGIFAIIGGTAILYGGNFLDYSALTILHSVSAYRRYFGILIAEIGVTLVVSMTLVVIFHILAFLPEIKRKL